MTFYFCYHGIPFAFFVSIARSGLFNPFSPETKRLGTFRLESALNKADDHRARKENIMVDSTITIENRREYSRVDVYIPLECRLLNKEEHGLVKSRLSADVMLADFKLMPPLANHPQFESLNQMNKKMDMIIKMIGLQYEGFQSLPFKFVSLGGNGMRFSSQQCYSLGDILECKMILTLQQSTAIYTYGEVVRVGGQNNSYFINIRFTAIDSNIRDKIIRFVFETEREIIRQRKKLD